MTTTIYLLYYVVQKTSFEITFKFLYGLMYGIKEVIQPYMSYVWFPRNIYGGQPGCIQLYKVLVLEILAPGRTTQNRVSTSTNITNT